MDQRLGWFNALPTIDAERALSACCASPSWARAVAAARPYADQRALVRTSSEVLAGLPWSDVAQALAAHPRIGQRAAGTDRDAVWSRREQAGVADSADTARVALREVNQAYEDRFGHVFLIFANGRSAAEILAAARSRLDNDTTTEREVVRAELTRITELRLTRLVTE
ncbi:2-oxo-4-hydroxy-4-carboxy-5-ureidoimidazoline decarboxylase [Micromonospora sp. WMMD1120]|uniref:2-oxo-4-hydroxy-4-carboxy-5-ureidoimidazoline decarboxylase n=1 Tax=Micromonospora sp. WMMD1120 TaxID=3016106 RepID=UPI002415E949|nr:2-oxo-4-hydroxy-4-carboxy-5-ureidoimidazoline decarboxylase [Micromonospora sp. WMMD1120]MDG4809446.1 2-oxo-4-hydroxy-4-carboxy-5-ureidoimidazoline decarboxylase [Micromonospora sp. WMMD1120]